MSDYLTPYRNINVNWAPNMMYHSGKGSRHSHGTPVDVVPTTAGIPSTLNPLPRYGTTVNFNPIPAVIPLPCHS